MITGLAKAALILLFGAALSIIAIGAYVAVCGKREPRRPVDLTPELSAMASCYKHALIRAQVARYKNLRKLGAITGQELPIPESLRHVEML